MQAGRIGLWYAMTTFDENKGQFAMYAYYKIRYYVLQELREQQVQKIQISTEEEKLMFLVDEGQEGVWSSPCMCEIERHTTGEERRLLYWFYGEYWTDKEIATHLDVKTDTIKKRRLRLVQRLRQTLKRSSFLG